MSDKEIQDAKLIQFENKQMYRGASYDMGVDKIIVPGGMEVEAYQIPPLGMVKVLSFERLKLPKGVLGYATVKTGLSGDGILAINIGLLDPEYEGLLSSILINFSKNDYFLQKKDKFLRLTFHKYKVPSDSLSVPTHTAKDDDMKAMDDAYVEKAKKIFVEKFSPTFLNIQENTKSFLRTELRNSALKWVPAAAFSIVLLTFLLNFGNTSVATYFAQRSIAQQAQSQTARDIDLIRTQSATEIDRLQTRVADLENQLRNLEGRVGQAGAASAPSSGRTPP